MPLAALTPVLNDLLHKGGKIRTPISPPNQLSNSNDTTSNTEYLNQRSIIGQTTSLPNPLTSSSVDDVSI
jgi:hypothetical protein